MAFINIDSIIGKPRNRIVRIGVELEGAWRKNQLPQEESIQTDTSVFKDPNTGNQVHPPGHIAGEVSLGPMQPAQLSRAVRKYYPHMINDTCGLHVHMSFDSTRYYSWLMDSKDYQDTIVEYLSRWAKEEGFAKDHHIWKRLSGKTEYCQDKFWPDLQVKSPKDHSRTRHGHRYTIINYCHAAHGTLECRVLPMMDTPEQAVRAVKQVLNITNACLVRLAARKQREQLKVASRLEDVEEIIEVRI